MTQKNPRNKGINKSISQILNETRLKKFKKRKKNKLLKSLLFNLLGDEDQEPRDPR